MGFLKGLLKVVFLIVVLITGTFIGIAVSATSGRDLAKNPQVANFVQMKIRPNLISVENDFQSSNLNVQATVNDLTLLQKSIEDLQSAAGVNMSGLDQSILDVSDDMTKRIILELNGDPTNTMPVEALKSFSRVNGLFAELYKENS